MAIAFLFIFITPAIAWPQEPQWNVVLKNGKPLTDRWVMHRMEKIVVGNATYPCCYFFNNGSALFFRMRLDSDRQRTRVKTLWMGYEIDSNANLSDYEWLILIDGIDGSTPEPSLSRGILFKA